MANTLPNTVAGRVEHLCTEADRFLAQGRHNAAIMRYATAIRVLPRPPERWIETPHILAAMIDACFMKGDFTSARHAALAALECPQVDQNPALRCKLGQIYYEEGEYSSAREQFLLALASGGEEVFADEDPKYRDFVGQGMHQA